MRVAVAVLALLVAGCLSSSPPPPQEPAPSGEAHADNSQANSTVIPSPAIVNTTSTILEIRIAEAGLSWSECRNVSYSAYHRQDWESGLLPPEYRPLNDGGGTGEMIFRGLDCAAFSVGNLTFIPAAQLSFLGIAVEAPEGFEGPSGNVYVLDWVTDDPDLEGQIAELNVPVWPGTLEVGGDTYRLETAEGPTATATELTSTAHTGNSTGQNRLHWKTGNLLCWVDLEHTVHVEMDTTVAVEGQHGSPYALSGPAHRIVGLGTRSTESGYFSPPTCLERPQ